jgi:creatinine amidohydrolase
VCAAIPEAILLPALPFGCAAEHMAFPGTVAIGAATLAAILTDLVRSLAAHGFAHALIFSAHGGNVATLARTLPALRAAATPMTVIAQTDLGQLTALWHGASAREGVDAVAAGHHAGEHETSIVTAIRPDAVRAHLLVPGYVASTADPQALFYPSLRAHAPSGTVGDPRSATAPRGARYLAAWAALLVSTYRLEKKSP